MSMNDLPERSCMWSTATAQKRLFIILSIYGSTNSIPALLLVIYYLLSYLKSLKTYRNHH